MPTHNGVGLNDNEDRTPMLKEPREPDPEDPVALLEPRTFRSPLKNCKLLSQGEILGGEFSLVAKKRSKENENQL